MCLLGVGTASEGLGRRRLSNQPVRDSRLPGPGSWLKVCVGVGAVARADVRTRGRHAAAARHHQQGSHKRGAAPGSQDGVRSGVVAGAYGGACSHRRPSCRILDFHTLRIPRYMCSLRAQRARKDAHGADAGCLFRIYEGDKVHFVVPLSVSFWGAGISILYLDCCKLVRCRRGCKL